MLQNKWKTADRKFPIYSQYHKKSQLPVPACATGLSIPSVKQISSQKRHTLRHTETHLPCSEFPVRCQAVSCIHEDFGNAESFLDGL